MTKMEIKQAQDFVDKKIIEYGGYWEPLSMMARLMEETGEVARVLNIKFGGKKSKFKGDGDGEIADEIGDLFFTLCALANKLEIDLGEVMKNKMDKGDKLYKEVYKNGD